MEFTRKKLPPLPSKKTPLKVELGKEVLPVTPREKLPPLPSKKLL